MFKKILSLMLVLLICCTTSTTVFSQAEHSHDGESSADAETVINSNRVQTATADPEYLEWLYGAPDEILSASTAELLEYFLTSSFMGQQVFSCSSTSDSNDIDFSCHKAFRELISRGDCLEALEDHAGNVLSRNDHPDKAKFEKLLAQASVKSLMTDLADHPNLQSIYAAQKATPER